jgi:hypothetical protein
MPPNKIMLIRHGEKAVVEPPFGITEDGAQDKHSLIVRGWQRAGALVPFFTSPTAKGVTTPGTIYAAGVAGAGADTDGDDASTSLRPQETVTPTAATLNVNLLTQFQVGQEVDLASDIRTRSGVVLVAWEHKHIPIIAGIFTSKAPDAWPGDRFDVVWILDYLPDSTYAFTQIDQSLLSGDAR